MDTLGPIVSVLIFQVSLYDKAPFGTIIKCVDYAGCPDYNMLHCTCVTLRSPMAQNISLYTDNFKMLTVLLEYIKAMRLATKENWFSRCLTRLTLAI